MMPEAAVGITEDGFLGGRLRLRQPRSGHRAGHDAMLLAAATVAHAGQRVADFGSGVGAAGLALATRVADLDLVLVEIDPALAALASTNAAANGIAATVLTLDIAADASTFAAAGLGPDSLDGVLMNPPFNDPARHRASPDSARQVAHVASPTTLQDWTHAARRVLRPGGVLTMIWRADGIAEVFGALDRGFGSIRLQSVHAAASAPAIRILVRAVKGGRAPTQIYPGLLLNDAAGLPNQQAQAALSGAAALPFAAP